MNMREEFEAWCKTFFTNNNLQKNEDGFYISGYALTHWACWQAALAAQAQQESLDAKRLDFVLSRTAFIEVVRFDDTFNRYKLMSQNEDEEFFCLHDENKSFSTEREAIDAAMLFIPPAPEGGEKQ